MRAAAGLWKWKAIAAVAAAVMAGVFAFSVSAATQTKVALIIGNGAYRNVSGLPNPPHDSADVAAAFKRLGFSVKLMTDASYEDMRRALLDFSRKARDSEMAIVYFAGHGMEINGDNWLIPVDAELQTDLDAEQEAISLRAVMLMVSAASKLGLVVLDACRNNPFAVKMKRTITSRAVTRGLGRIEPANNVLVAYAAKDGTTALDGTGRNSPFTAAFLKYVERPGIEINFLFRNIRDDVIAATKNEQEPYVYGSLSSEAIYLVQPPAAPAVPSPDQLAWSLLKETTDEAALKRFIAQYPNSTVRNDAEARIAALETEAAKAVPTPSALVDPQELTRSLQFELKRVGCFTGAVNGKLDDATKAAWRNFTKLTSISMPDGVSLDAIKAVRGVERRVCPMVCPEGERAQGDHCVALTPPHKAELGKVRSNAGSADVKCPHIGGEGSLMSAQTARENGCTRNGH